MVSICPLLWQRDVKLQQTKNKNWIWAAEQRCYGIAFHSSTTLWRRSCMVAMVNLVWTALPTTVQWGSGLDCMLAKQDVLLVYSRHKLYHPLFRTPCLYLPMTRALSTSDKTLKLWDDRGELGTKDWAVHRVTLSNACTDVILGKILATNASIHEAVIHLTKTIHQWYRDHGITG